MANRTKKSQKPEKPQPKPQKPQPKQEIKATGGSTISGIRQTYLNVEKMVLNIPLWISIPIAILLLSLPIGGTYLYQNFKYDSSPMGGELNIVIEPFMEEDGEKLVESDLGFRIAQQFATRLKTDIREGDVFKDVDINVQVRGPDDKLPLPHIQNPDKLETGAQELGEILNAQIIVYGVITYDVIGSPVISPKFFISQDAFGDAQEILGESQLGGSFRLAGETTSGADLMGENKNLRSRVEVLSLLFKGLTAFVSEDYELSLEYFSRAQASNLWESTQGKEVVFMLAGNTAMRLSNSYIRNGQLTEADSVVSSAEDYYEKALSDQPEYARAYLGLGSVEYYYATRPAIGSGMISDADLKALEKQEEYLQLALDAQYQPTTADIKEKVAFDRAQANLISFQLSNDNNFLNEAIRNYLAVVNAFDAGNRRLRELAAHSHSGLGLIYRIQKDREPALSHYESAIQTTHSSSLKTLYTYYKARTYLEMGNNEEAKKYYQAVIFSIGDLEKRMSPNQIRQITEEAKGLGINIGVNR